MLNIGSKISQLRKHKSLSQADLAKAIGVSRTIVGNYERSANMPSVDVLLKLANTFNVSVDFLIGEGQMASYDKEVLRRIDDIEGLDSATRDKLFFLIDNVLQNVKAKKAFA